MSSASSKASPSRAGEPLPSPAGPLDGGLVGELEQEAVEATEATEALRWVEEPRRAAGQALVLVVVLVGEAARSASGEADPPLRGETENCPEDEVEGWRGGRAPCVRMLRK